MQPNKLGGASANDDQKNYPMLQTCCVSGCCFRLLLLHRAVDLLLLFNKKGFVERVEYVPSILIHPRRHSSSAEGLNKVGQLNNPSKTSRVPVYMSSDTECLEVRWEWSHLRAQDGQLSDQDAGPTYDSTSILHSDMKLALSRTESHGIEDHSGHTRYPRTHPVDTLGYYTGSI